MQIVIFLHMLCGDDVDLVLLLSRDMKDEGARISLHYDNASPLGHWPLKKDDLSDIFMLLSVSMFRRSINVHVGS